MIIHAGNKKAEERFGQNLSKSIEVLVPNKSVVIENEYQNCFVEGNYGGCGYFCAFFCSEIVLYNNRKEIIDNFDKILFNTISKTSEMIDPCIGKRQLIMEHDPNSHNLVFYDKIRLDGKDYFIHRTDLLRDDSSCININCFKYVIGQEMFKTINTELQSFKTQGR